MNEWEKRIPTVNKSGESQRLSCRDRAGNIAAREWYRHNRMQCCRSAERKLTSSSVREKIYREASCGEGVWVGDAVLIKVKSNELWSNGRDLLLLRNPEGGLHSNLT